MTTAGFLGAFPAGLTTGNQSIGAASKNATGKGYPQSYPAALTGSLFNIGAAQKIPATQYADTFSDGITATDTLSGLMEGVATFSDAATGSDTQAATVNYLAVFSDTATGADTMSASLAGVTTFSDAVTGADTMGAAMSGTNTFSDSVTGSDTMIGGIGYTFTFSDAIAPLDVLTNTAGYSSTFSDSITATDSVVGGIGYLDTIDDFITAADSFTAVVSPSPNIILAGTIDYSNPYCIPNAAILNLNFSVILGDDNFIRVNAPNIITGQPLQLTSAIVYFYAPETNTNPVITKAATAANGFFLFPLSHSDIAGFSPGLYPWLAVITLTDGSSHILNEGDAGLTTGVMNLVNRPY